jgi:hypothetical protein
MFLHIKFSYRYFLRDITVRNSVIRREFHQEEDIKGSTKIRSDLWRFKDLVVLNCNYMLKILEHQSRPLSGLDVQFTDRDLLEGWSFWDIVKQRDKMEPRIVYLQQSGRGWSNYSRRVRAIKLVGPGFGDLIRPADRDTMGCPWAIVPEGRDYLATTVSVLQANMKLYGGLGSFPELLADGIRLHQLTPPFDKCQCPSRKCYPVQMICPKVSFFVNQPRVCLDNSQPRAMREVSALVPKECSWTARNGSGRVEGNARSSNASGRSGQHEQPCTMSNGAFGRFQRYIARQCRSSRLKLCIFWRS